MESFLRSWRQDALNKGQHESAIYIGDKVLALTDSDNDAFWLAQVHFSNNNYTRALALLSKKDLISRNSSCRYLAAHCYIKQNKFDQALSILGDHNPTHLISTSSNSTSRRKLHHLSDNSHVTLRNGKSALSRSDRTDRSEERGKEDASNIKFEAAMCYLRGLCHARQNAFDRARDCYKDAVRIDVQCFEAFDQLMKNSLMSPAEELEFLESLDFDSVASPSTDPNVRQEAAEFTKLLYTTRMSKYSSPAALSHATETLSTHYHLADNPDLLLSRAETLYTQCRFPEALALTSSILSSSNSASSSSIASQGSQGHNLGHSPSVYPLHLACLYETGATNALFLLSHTLADNAPEEPYTYLAIGIYYMSVSKVAEARRFFSKASLLDPHSPAAWIGFAHTFAAEGEHDQAIAAYSTAARLFQGSHLPQLFLGMQHLALNNMSLAHEYLSAAYSMSSGSLSNNFLSGSESGSGDLPPPPPSGGDPLVLNELGVVLYHEANLEGAAELFKQALALAVSLGCDPGAWMATRANLGHTYRRLGEFEAALAEFDECLRIGAGGTSTSYASSIGGGVTAASSSGVGGYEDRGLTGSLHTARGLVLLELGRTMEAVTALHEAVRILGTSGTDVAAGTGVAGTLLTKALEIWGSEQDNDEVVSAATSRQGGGVFSEKTGAKSKSASTKGKGKSTETTAADRGGNKARALGNNNNRYGAEGEEWNGGIVQPEPNGVYPPLAEQTVAMELDGEAENILDQALVRARSRHATTTSRNRDRDRGVGLGIESAQGQGAGAGGTRHGRIMGRTTSRRAAG